MKFSPNILRTKLDLLTPQGGVLGSTMSSKTPGGNLEDRRSLDRLFVNQSTSNLQETFLGMVQPFWHHLQVSQEQTCSPRLQEILYNCPVPGWNNYPFITGKVLFSCPVSGWHNYCFKTGHASKLCIVVLFQDGIITVLKQEKFYIIVLFQYGIITLL